ncbi:uromodulin-like [Osmerus mordax]|uniref:uromodulin-like n=1 Tax=Osmerus mordax TaxID=8014 RepID=UPI00350F6177
MLRSQQHCAHHNHSCAHHNHSCCHHNNNYSHNHYSCSQNHNSCFHDHNSCSHNHYSFSHNHYSCSHNNNSCSHDHFRCAHHNNSCSHDHYSRSHDHNSFSHDHYSFSHHNNSCSHDHNSCSHDHNCSRHNHYTCAYHNNSCSHDHYSYSNDNSCSHNHSCFCSYLEVGLLKSQLLAERLDSSSAHLADPRCTSQEINGTLWFQMERWEGSCGNVLTTNGSHAFYSNSLFVYSVSETALQTFKIPFFCCYPLETDASLDVAIKPYLDVEGAVKDEGAKARASMSLFRDANYTAPYPVGPVTLPLGSILHVGVSVEETDAEAFVVVLEDCYATHSSDPYDLLKYFLIQHKCPADRHQVTVEESGLSLQARFSALLFLFQGDYRDIYLHCSLNLCDQRNSSCSPMCLGRSVRSVDKLVPLKPVTIGPITWAQSLE